MRRVLAEGAAWKIFAGLSRRRLYVPWEVNGQFATEFRSSPICSRDVTFWPDSAAGLAGTGLAGASGDFRPFSAARTRIDECPFAAGEKPTRTCESGIN